MKSRFTDVWFMITVQTKLEFLRKANICTAWCSLNKCFFFLCCDSFTFVLSAVMYWPRGWSTWSFLISLIPLLDSPTLLSSCLSPAHKRCERRSRGGEPRREEGKQQAFREMRNPLSGHFKQTSINDDRRHSSLMDRCVHGDLYIDF